MKLKVIQLINSLDLGGAETLVKDYALHMNKEKFECIVMCISRPKNKVYEAQLIDNKIKIIYLEDKCLIKNSNNRLSRLLNYIHRFYLINKYVKQEKPQIIHTHQAINKYIMFINSKKNNINFYHTYHTEVRQYISKFRAYKLTTQYCIKYNGMIPIALHEKMKNESDKIFGINNTRIINNGIEINKFRMPKKKKADILRELKICENSLVIGHVGRFESVKNHDFIIDVFNEVKNKREHAYLLLIGEGELQKDIKQKVKEYGLEKNVKFLGNREDIPELMRAMDIFIFPSLYEGFPISLIEAQAADIRCIISTSISENVLLSDKIRQLDLNEPVEIWRDAILEENFINHNYKDIEEFNIQKIIKKVEIMYLENYFAKDTIIKV